MKEAFDKLRSKIAEKKEPLRPISDYVFGSLDLGRAEGKNKVIDEILSIISEVEAEYGNRWITDRMPTEEECGAFGRGWFLATVNANKLTTIPMQCEYTTVRGKEVVRWLAYGRISPWEVIAWMPLPTPYQKGE